MASNVSKFRTLKWGDPEGKLRMLPEDRARRAGVMVWNLATLAFAAAVGFGGVYLFTSDIDVLAKAQAMFANECNIKGNISIGSGERIYHMPGQEYYRATIIRPEYGERWFCSEEEARAAGWRRSGV